jgi:hypothetical protein
MALVTVYKHVWKPGRDGTLKPFTPVRAVGLSLEEGWKTFRSKGSSTSVEDLQRVRLSGELRILSGHTWSSQTSCTLQLRPRDSALALLLLRKQRALLADLGFNAWFVDKQGACGNTFDLLGDFSTTRCFGVEGRVWIELKVFAEATFEDEMERCREQLKRGLAEEADRDPHLGGVLLVAVRVVSGGRGSWATPLLSATLLKRASSRWQCVVGEETRKGKGKTRKAKPTLATVLPKMEWAAGEGGCEVGVLSQFLEKCGRPHMDPGRRAKALNAKLANERFDGRIYKSKLKTRPGKQPWVAARSTFRALYKHV